MALKTLPARRLAVLLPAMAALIAGAPAAMAAETKTSKERLSDKAADEQRVDNCRVPLARRGATPRPDCPDGADANRPATGQDTPGSSRSR
jgi:hypothetical protein